MAASALTREEGIGLGVSIVGHAALLAVLLYQPGADEVVQRPDRIEVTIADETGLQSASPDPSTSAAASVAPTIGDVLPTEILDPLPLPIPEILPAPTSASTPSPSPAPRVAPRPTPRPAPTRSTRRSDPVADALRSSSRAAPSPTPAPSRAAPTPTPAPSRRTGGSRIGSDFLEGSPSAESSGSSSSPRAAITGRVQSALSGAISRQLKPHWVAPQGVDAEELVTILAFDLNQDGSLKGRPRVVRQLGINDANNPQASRHAEQAIRAVTLAAPFDLPSEYYDGWKRVSAFRFDKRL